MSIGQDIADGFDVALSTSERILSDVLRSNESAWVGWTSDKPVPVIEYEKFDYYSHLAEVLINSCYNSVLNGSIAIPVVGAYPAVPTGTYTSVAPAVCTWSGNTVVQDHIDAVVSELAKMVPALGSEQSPTALLDFSAVISNEIHTMVTSGELSANGVIGTFVFPNGSSVVSIDVSGSLSGSAELLTGSVFQALSLADNDAVGQALGLAFITYCASLAGNVSGSSDASACVGVGAGFIVA